MAQVRKFIDIGANLTDLMYCGLYNGSKKHEADLKSVLERSWSAGLQTIIVTAGNLEESTKALELAKADDRLYVTVGCHPTRCQEFEKEGETPNGYLEKLKELIVKNKRKVVAVGECGLDYDRTQFCSIDIQKRYFEMQLKLSIDFKLPLFLHCRNAADDLYNILTKFDGLKGVVHSFDGTIEEAQRFIDLGLYIGINGCSLKTEENLTTVSKIPSNKLLIETDCPWCEVRPSHAGFKHILKNNLEFPSVKKEKWRPDALVKSRNEPCNIRHVFDILSAVRDEDKDILEYQIFNNTVDLFF